MSFVRESSNLVICLTSEGFFPLLVELSTKSSEAQVVKQTTFQEGVAPAVAGDLLTRKQGGQLIYIRKSRALIGS